MIALRLLGALALLVAFALLGWVLLALLGGHSPPWVTSEFPLLLALAGVLYLAGRLLLYGPRSTCPHCGGELSFWQREFSGCPWCRAAEARPATAWWGLLLVLLLIDVALFRSDLRELRSSVDNLKKRTDTQANEIQELRKAVAESHQGGAGPGK